MGTICPKIRGRDRKVPSGGILHSCFVFCFVLILPFPRGGLRTVETNCIFPCFCWSFPLVGIGSPINVVINSVKECQVDLVIYAWFFVVRWWRSSGVSSILAFTNVLGSKNSSKVTQVAVVFFVFFASEIFLVAQSSFVSIALVKSRNTKSFFWSKASPLGFYGRGRKKKKIPDQGRGRMLKQILIKVQVVCYKVFFDIFLDFVSVPSVS